MKTFKTKQVVLALTLGLTTSYAMAQTEALNGSALLTTGKTVRSMDGNNYNAANYGVGRLVQLGEPQGNLQPLKGFAKDLPLITVLKQITPNGWVVKKNDTADNRLNVQQLVSWQGGQSWVDTLSDVSANYSVNTLVNWNAKEIVLSPVAQAPVKKEGVFTTERVTATNTNVSGDNLGTVSVVKEPTKTSIFELAGTETSNVTVGSSQAPEIKEVVTSMPAPVKTIEVAPVAAPVASWTLSSDKSLKENVIAWGKVAGYKVVWNGEDYPVDETRGLSGEFDGDNGPIKQLASDYGPKSRVQQPLAFQFFQNRTLVVDDWKFEQQGYPQFAQKNII